MMTTIRRYRRIADAGRDPGTGQGGHGLRDRRAVAELARRAARHIAHRRAGQGGAP